MKILWLSENGMDGKIPRNFEQMRTEFAWFVASDADHKNIGELPNLKDNSYDAVIIILPKNEGILQQMSTYTGFNLIGQLRRVAKKIGWMQEGPVTYYQDYSIEIQLWWYSVLDSMDFLMVHNSRDAHYIKGMIKNKPIFINHSLMIEDALSKDEMIAETKNRNDAVIGGNFVSWYGGFDSYIVASEFETNISVPTMGRMKEGELSLEGITHIPYKTWTEWMVSLSKFKYAVHLMPTFAAGTFALNCAYLGIPCIGYSGLDTQEILHPSTTVDLYNITKAVNIAKRLKEERQFYKKCSEESKLLYKHHYNESSWKKSFFDFIKDIQKG